MNKTTKRKRAAMKPEGKNPPALDPFPKVGASAKQIMYKLWGPGGRKVGAM
jgi:hypothetical protein